MNTIVLKGKNDINGESLTRLIIVSRYSIIKKDQLKLTGTLIAVVFVVLLSEISSIVTYDKVTEFLIGKHYPDYMKKTYKLQVLISNLILILAHFCNFFLYCALNKKYLKVLKLRFSFLSRSIRFEVNNHNFK